MTVLSIKSFRGEIPRLPADRLPEGAAQRAVNLNTAHEELRTLEGLGLAYAAHPSACPVRALFTDDGLRFFCWPVPTRAYLSPTIGDTARRVYYQSHGSGLRVTQTDDMRLSSLEPRAPTYSWAAGVRRPTGALSALRDGPLPEAGRVTVAVVATVENAWGEESAPTHPVLLEKGDSQAMTLSVDHVPDGEQQTIAGVNFYRTYPSTNGSIDYFLINSDPVVLVDGVATLFDDSTEPITATVLRSGEWDGPPPELAHLTYAGNGFFVASAGKDLLACEPYRPHAWPYRMSLPFAIVGITAVEGGLLVITQGQTYLVGGTHPTQLSQQLLPAEQAGWSDTAVTRVEGAAVYASNDGLVDVFGGVPSVAMSQQLFTRRDWRERYGALRQNLRLAQHDGFVLGLVDPSYPTPAVGEAFLLRLDESEGAYCRLVLPEAAYSASVSGTTDQLYVGTATGFAEFAGSNARLAGEWHSGDYRYSRPVAFHAAILDCDGTFEVSLYADGVVVTTETVVGRTAFRLDAEVEPAYRWSVRLVGAGVVRSFEMGPSFAALQRV